MTNRELYRATIVVGVLLHAVGVSSQAVPEAPAAPAAPAGNAEKTPKAAPETGTGTAAEAPPTTGVAPEAAPTTGVAPEAAPTTGVAPEAAPAAEAASATPKITLPAFPPAPTETGDGEEIQDERDEQDEQDDEVEEIVVTGSRVKRTSFSQPSAVQVISRKDLEASGADNMADVIRNMSINYGSELNTDVSTAAGGTAQFNLRGLGLNSTLVLLNGRRMVNSATVSTDGTNFVDVNAIPLSAVERIEVLKAGASAIYGSDAVAGVVNIITRKDMDGFEVQLGGQTTDDLDQNEWDVALIGGARGERTRVNLMMSYFKRSPLDAQDRDFTKNGRNVSLVGQPGTYIRQNQFGGDAAAYTDPTCGDDPYSAIAIDELTQTIQLCTFNFNPYMQLMIDEQRFNSYGTLEHDISDHTKAFFEVGYAASRSFRTLSPSFPILQRIIVPIDNPYNTVVNDLRWVGRTQGGGADRTVQYFQSDTLHAVAGLSGDLGGIAPNTAVEDFEWELAGTFSRNQFRFGMDDTLKQPLQEALQCGVQEDPGDCLNPFQDGAPNSRALLDSITGELRVPSDTELGTVNAGLTGPIMELPGGDLGFAVGAQMRNESARSDPDHDANELNYIFLIGGPDYQAERRILAGYGELVIPAAVGLELQAAGRIEDYDDMGSSLDPKFGVSWTPAATFAGMMPGDEPSNLRVRGTFATSFRAPTLLQMNGAQTAIEETFDVGVDDGGNPVREGRSVYRGVRSLGNPNLGPETSAALTAGVEWKPAEGLVVELDYFRYDFDDLVIKENHQQLVDEDFDCEADPETCDPRIRRDSNFKVEQIDTAFVNAPSVITDGIDVGVRYRSDFGGDAGNFTLAGTGTYVMSYDIELAGSDQVIEAAGNRNSANPARPIPQVRANFPLGWDLDSQSAGLVVHYTGSYDNDDPTSDIDDPIDAWVTFDLQYAFRVDEGDGMATTFKVGVINLLDSDPPKLDAAYGFDVFVHDPRGRLVYGRLIQEF